METREIFQMLVKKSDEIILPFLLAMNMCPLILAIRSHALTTFVHKLWILEPNKNNTSV